VRAAAESIADHIRRHPLRLRLAGRGVVARAPLRWAEECPREGRSNRAHRHGCTCEGVAAFSGGAESRTGEEEEATCSAWRKSVKPAEPESGRRSKTPVTRTMP
jgi:hypothetical protein